MPIILFPIVQILYYCCRRNVTVRIRRPIRLRPPSDRIAFAVQSDCVRVPMTFAKE